MAVFDRLHMPSLGRATDWLNSEPLGPAEPRGHVVLVDFWTLTLRIWSAFANHYWPTLYFVDAKGIIRDHHFGEGRYEHSERVIQRLLGVKRELVSVEGGRRGGGGRP